MQNSMNDEYRVKAAWYDRVLGSLLTGLRREVAWACRELDLRSVVDVGCGTGAQCLALQAIGVRYFGVEPSPAMRKVAATKINTLLGGEACRLPLADQSCDAALLCLVLHTMPSEQRLPALQEACRIGRHVLIIDFRNPERNLDVPAMLLVRAVEHLMEKTHSVNYAHFMKNRAIEGLITRLRATHESPDPKEQGGGIPKRRDAMAKEAEADEAGKIVLRKPVLGGAASLVIWKTRREHLTPVQNQAPRKARE